MARRIKLKEMSGRLRICLKDPKPCNFYVIYPDYRQTRLRLANTLRIILVTRLAAIQAAATIKIAPDTA